MDRPEFMLEFEYLSHQGDGMGVVYEIPIYYSGLQIDGVKYSGFETMVSKDGHYIMDLFKHYLPNEGVDFSTCTLRYRAYMVMIFNYDYRAKKWEFG